MSSQGPNEQTPDPRPNALRLSRRGVIAAGGLAPLMLGTAGDAAAQPVPAPPPAPEPVRFTVNGRAVVATVEPRVTLLDYLRGRLHLTGTKKGCNEGACGTCTVLVDGRRMNSCLTLAVQCAGRDITTIEGLASGDELHPVQQAFIDHDAFQCGYCTPGQILSAVACIAEGHATDAASVREWMSGNICRCAAYPQITAAVLAAGRAEG